MKAIFLATTAIMLVAAGMAGAADLGVAYKPAPARPACAQFGGFYVGANIGAGYYTAHRNDDDGYFNDNAGHTTSGSGWNGGVQGGYNWQRGCTVLGVEVDWSWSSAKAQFQDGPNQVPAITLTIDSKLRSFGTARTRTGIIVDDVLLYVTGGLAWANVDNTYAFIFQSIINEQHSFSSTRWGFTAGFGTEWALGGNWTLKSEALYMQFKQQQDQFFSPFAGRNVRFTNNDNVWVARVGVNYVFGSGAVRAAY